MTINIERMEVMGVNVGDVPAAEALFTRLFGLSFTSLLLGGPDLKPEAVPLQAGELTKDPNSVSTGAPVPVAMEPTGVLQLVQTPEGMPTNTVRNIHFKVADIDAAIAEMQANGIRVMGNIRVGGVREAIFNPEDLFGVRICLVEYHGPSMIEAMLG
jgi:catechol 2,3-dioxygenase-like lactoylglutathione lyase family enzyme